MLRPPRLGPRLRALTYLGVAALTLVPSTGTFAAQAPATRLSRPGAQALQAMTRLDGDFYDDHRRLYVVQGLAYAPTASLWSTSQVLSAAIHVAQITHASSDLARVRRIIGSLKAYAGPLGVFHTRTVPTRTYYDDNNWIALDLLDAYTLLHDQAYLHLAEHIFQFETTGWDRAGGGIFWAVGDHDRNTVSTVPPIIIGLRLTMITHNPSYLPWAERLYRWENAHLRAPNGLYWDHIKPNGSIDRHFYSYNQGLMIEANLAFAASTGKARYLDEARRIATLTAKLHPGPWHPLGMGSVFDAIYYQALDDLNRAAAHAASLKTAREYLAWAWPTARMSRSVRTEDHLFEQAAFVIDAAVVSDDD